jgi:hypothetical protein
MNPRAFVDSIVLRRMDRGLQWLLALFYRCSITNRTWKREIGSCCMYKEQ